MLSDKEEKFLVFWEKNREHQKRLKYQLLMGTPLGLFIAIGIILCIGTGWYERADMEANAKLSPTILIISVMAIVLFTGFFFKRHQWDMREQRYKELLYKKQKENAAKH